MQIQVHEDKKIVCVWLTKDESSDAATPARIKNVIAQFRPKKYLVVIFRSGTQELTESTRALLRYNRRLTAEREVLAEKTNALSG